MFSSHLTEPYTAKTAPKYSYLQTSENQSAPANGFGRLFGLLSAATIGARISITTRYDYRMQLGARASNDSALSWKG